MAKVLYTNLNVLSAPYYQAEIAGVIIGATKTNIDSKKKSLNLTSLQARRLVSDGKSDLNSYKVGVSFIPSMDDIQDPNYFEKLLSLSNCEMTVTYGDASPATTSRSLNQAALQENRGLVNTSFLYKNETMLITKYGFNMDFSGNALVYEIEGTSAVYQSKDDKVSFPEIPAGSKVSTIILSVYNEHLKYQYYGGNDIDLDTDDINIPESIGSFTGAPINYVKKLAGMMVWNENSIYNSKTTNNLAAYYFWVTDDSNGKTVHVKRNKVASEISSIDSESKKVLVLDIGYPRSSGAIDFSVSNAVGYAHIFDGLRKSTVNKNSYTINEKGEIVQYDQLLSGDSSTPSKSSEMATTNWWTFMQLQSYSGSIRVHGIVNNIKLMDIVECNILYNGMKYHASGYYYVKGITITINSGSFYSELDVVRIPGEDGSGI